MRQRKGKPGCPWNLRRRYWLAHHGYARSAPCHYCGRRVRFEDATVEHLTPVERGGTDDFSNLAIACEPCNWARNLEVQAGPSGAVAR